MRVLIDESEEKRIKRAKQPSLWLRLSVNPNPSPFFSRGVNQGGVNHCPSAGPEASDCRARTYASTAVLNWPWIATGRDGLSRLLLCFPPSSFAAVKSAIEWLPRKKQLVRSKKKEREKETASVSGYNWSTSHVLFSCSNHRDTDICTTS
jgi:hypothetical protein